MKNQKGFTLVELLVGMAILSIVAAAITSFIVSGSRSYAAANTEIVVQQEAQLAMNQISDVVIDTTRSVNYTGYAADGGSQQVEKDADFTIDVEDKSLTLFNGVGRVLLDAGGNPVLDADGNPEIEKDADGKPIIDGGSGNQFNFQFYYDKSEEKLYYSQIPLSSEVFPQTEADGMEVLAEYVKDFSVDLSQVEEKRVVQLFVSYEYNNRIFETSNNITIRNKVLVNSVNMAIDRSVELRVIPREGAVVLEPGEDYYQFSTPIVDGRNVTDKSVTWSITPEEQSKLTGSDTGFLDAANGIIHISSAETVKSFKVTVTTNAVNSQGNPDSEEVTVHVKRADKVNLYKSYDSDETNKPLEISPGCTFTISVANVVGNKIGVTCSNCGDDTAIDQDVVEGHRDRPFAWRIYKFEDDGKPNPDGWDPYAYVSVVGQPDAKSATFYVDPNTPSDGSIGITIQATSLLSVKGNDYGRSYDPAFGGIELVVKKKKQANIGASGSLNWGASTEVSWENLSHFHYYVVCVRVREYGTEGGDKIMMYLSEGTTTRVTPDMFGVEDVSKPWYLSIQVLNPGKLLPSGVDLHEQSPIKIGAQIDDPTVLDIIDDYLNNCDSTGTYVGTKYLHSDKLEATINPPEIYYAYNGKDKLGGELKLKPVSILGALPWTEFSVDYVLNTRDMVLGKWFANNNIKYSVYKETADGKRQEIYKYNGEGDYYEGDSSPYGGFLKLGEINGGAGSTSKIKLDSNSMGGASEAVGKYLLIPTIKYKQDSGADHAGGVPVYYVSYIPNYDNEQCYEDERSTVYFELTGGGNLNDLWISSYDNFYKGEIYFPTPSDSEFRNYFTLGNPSVQSVSPYNYFRLKDKDGNIRGVEFSRMTCEYISTKDEYKIELFYKCTDSLWGSKVEMSAGTFICSADGTKWDRKDAGALDGQLNMGNTTVASNGNARITIGDNKQVEAYIPLPTDEKFTNNWYGNFRFNLDEIKKNGSQTVTNPDGLAIKYRNGNGTADAQVMKATCTYISDKKTYKLEISYCEGWQNKYEYTVIVYWQEGTSTWTETEPK